MITRDAISEADLERALELAPPDIRPFVLLAGWAGLRCREIAELRATDLLWTGEPAIMVRVGNEQSSVSMSPWLVDQLHSCEFPVQGYLFAAGDGRVPADAIACIGGQYLRSLGINATMHHLRNRFLILEWRAIRGSQ